MLMLLLVLKPCRLIVCIIATIHSVFVSSSVNDARGSLDLSIYI